MELWFLIALVAPLLWSIVNLIDAYFVESVYENAYDATILVGLFQLIPWLFVLIGGHSFHLPSHAYLFFLAGVCFNISFVFFYFKFLFANNDVTLLQILANLAVPLTLLLSWIFLGERLSVSQGLGMILVLAGTAFLSLPGTRTIFPSRASLWYIIGTIFFLALYFFISKLAYLSAPGNFFDQYLVFSLGGAAVGITCLISRFRGGREVFYRLGKLTGKYIFVFLLTEGLVLLGNFTSQRALSLTPSATLVATLESVMPLFLIVLSLVIVFLQSLWGDKKASLTELYRRQYASLPTKLITTVVTVYGVYLIS